MRHLALVVLTAACVTGPAQQRDPAASASTGTPPIISLEQAIRLAQANEPTFAAAAAESHALALERTNARVALLPIAVDHNQAIYTQPNGVPASRIGQTTGAPAPIFIANNAVREYVVQAQINETIGLRQIGAIRFADANASRAAAETEILRRGLVATVVGLYYTVGASEEKLRATTAAQAEAQRFVDLTRKREAAREVAHADVLRAQLQQQGRDREQQDAQLAADRARLELAALLFPDPATPFETNAPAPASPLPDYATVQASAAANNAELRSALASLQLSQAETYSARAALLPELGVNITYGIDSTTFASSQIDPDGSRINNLGYSGAASLDIPLWDWLTSERRIRQAHIRESASRVAVTAAQRRMLANLAEFYAEATSAARQLASLEQSVADAHESLRLTNLRYVDGESTALEVVDAQTSATTAELARADGLVRAQTALAQLQTLTGELPK